MSVGPWQKLQSRDERFDSCFPAQCSYRVVSGDMRGALRSIRLGRCG
jgi:hypothetical protein